MFARISAQTELNIGSGSPQVAMAVYGGAFSPSSHVAGAV